MKIRPKITINKIIKKNNTIEISFDYDEKLACFRSGVTPFFQYEQNIESVPDSIAVIPFLSNIIPIVFLYDAEIVIDEIDSVFLNSIAEYRKGYQKMIPQLKFKGAVNYKRIVENNYKAVKTCSLYSGGLDALNTLCMHDNEISDCAIIYTEHNRGWANLKKTVIDATNKFNKNLRIIKSNFWSYLSMSELNRKIERIAFAGDWYESLLHGILLLGHTAPLAFINGYKTIYIASTFTKFNKVICASDPKTDNCFRFGKTHAVHDGFEYDRCDKVLNISNHLKRKRINSLTTMVCWKGKTGINCGKCEKCIRTYLNCRVMGVNPAILGAHEPPNTHYLISFVNNLNLLSENKYLAFYIDIKKHFLMNYKRVPPPEDLKWIYDFKLPSKLKYRFVDFLYRRAFPGGTVRHKIAKKIYLFFKCRF